MMARSTGRAVAWGLALVILAWVGLVAPEDHVSRRRHTELACERDVLRVIEPLIAKENHFPLQQRGPDRPHLIIAQRLRQIDATDFGAHVHRKRSDLDA